MHDQQSEHYSESRSPSPFGNESSSFKDMFDVRDVSILSNIHNDKIIIKMLSLVLLFFVVIYRMIYHSVLNL